jgi:hypothetical protein
MAELAPQPGVSRKPRGTTKAPTDLTGRADERLRTEHADEISEQAEHMAMVQAGQRRRKGQVHDFRDASRPKVAPKPVAPEPTVKRDYQVRMLADIENMTFGREIIDAGDFSNPNSPRMPILGSLKTYTFKEGEEYIVDQPLYEHLSALGYIYDSY